MVEQWRSGHRQLRRFEGRRSTSLNCVEARILPLAGRSGDEDAAEHGLLGCWVPGLLGGWDRATQQLSNPATVSWRQPLRISLRPTGTPAKLGHGPHAR